MKISVLGASGWVGSSTAFNIALHGLADEIVMIGGKQQNLLKHHAMDLAVAATEEDVLVRVGGYEEMSGSEIIVNAAGLHHDLYSTGRANAVAQNLPIIREIAQNISRYCPEAVVITATNPIDPLNYAVCLFSSNRDRSRFIGYSRNDSTRFRMLTARALGVKTRQVEAVVMGEHGANKVLLFSLIKVDGKPVTVSEENRQKISREYPDVIRSLEELGIQRTTGWTCAAGITAVCRAIINDTGEMIPCSAVLDGEYGYRRLSMGVPAVIGRRGIKEILEWKLTPEESRGLEIAADKLNPGMEYVEEQLGEN
ncbi:malate dehydrogenase [Chloroflexota bacterium]